MAADEGNGALIKGLILGGIAGAGAMIWNAPQSGARTREQIQEWVERVLFKVLDMPVGLRGGQASAAAPTVVEPVTATDMLIPPSLGEVELLPEPQPLPGPAGADLVIDDPDPADLPR